jgi:hypothetical protein
MPTAQCPFAAGASAPKTARISSFVNPSKIFVWHVMHVIDLPLLVHRSQTFYKIYAPQTKILEGRTNRPERVFEALFKGVSTRFGLQIVEKCFEKSF